MVIVAEPGRRAIECAVNIIKLSGDIGVKNFVVIGNKITSEADKEYIKKSLPEAAAFMPYAQNIRESDRDGVSVLDALNQEQIKIIEDLINELYNSSHR
jgi:CO dehydrogenase maturation factor